MPEETASTTAEPARRRPVATASQSSGGGAKILAAILAVVVAGLGFALYKRNTAAGAQTETDAKTIGSLSNQVTELRTKLALERSNLEVARSNHLALIERRTAELVTTSNRFVQTSLLLDRAREETHAAQAQIPAKAAALATLEAQHDELQRTAAMIPGYQRDLAAMKEQLQQAHFAQAALQESLGRARAGQAGLEHKLEDPAFLRLQARRADEAASLRQRAAAGQRLRLTDSRVRLDLQPDGTIRPTSTAGVAPKK